MPLVVDDATEELSGGGVSKLEARGGEDQRNVHSHCQGEGDADQGEGSAHRRPDGLREGEQDAVRGEEDGRQYRPGCEIERLCH